MKIIIVKLLWTFITHVKNFFPTKHIKSKLLFCSAFRELFVALYAHHSQLFLQQIMFNNKPNHHSNNKANENIASENQNKEDAVILTQRFEPMDDKVVQQCAKYGEINEQYHKDENGFLPVFGI